MCFALLCDHSKFVFNSKCLTQSKASTKYNVSMSALFSWLPNMQIAYSFYPALLHRLWPLWLRRVFLRLSRKRHDFQEKRIWHKTCFFCIRTFYRKLMSFQEEFNVVSSWTYLRVDVKCLIFLFNLCNVEFAGLVLMNRSSFKISPKSR